MRIQVQRYGDLGMAKPLRGHLGVDARGQHVRGVGVAQIVKANTGQGGSMNFFEQKNSFCQEEIDFLQFLELRADLMLSKPN
jgi:hypothetical protein